jgi:hypothetical protein
MTDRTTELEAAVRAQDALIAEAQRLLADGQRANGLNRDTLITQLRGSSRDRASVRRSVWRPRLWARILATSLKRASLLTRRSMKFG